MLFMLGDAEKRDGDDEKQSRGYLMRLVLAVQPNDGNNHRKHEF